jgi:hypothetical protein
MEMKLKIGEMCSGEFLNSALFLTKFSGMIIQFFDAKGMDNTEYSTYAVVLKFGQLFKNSPKQFTN